MRRAPPQLLDNVPRDEAPVHLRLLAEHARTRHGQPPAADALDSIPFFSLCHGVLLPLTGLTSTRTAALFGPELTLPNAWPRERLIREFFAREVGLTLVEKLGCILGDPFQGRPSTFRQERLLQLLRSTWLRGDRELLDRLAVVGEVAALFAESRPALHSQPPLTAAEMLRVLAILPELSLTERMDAARSLLVRCGKLEAYFLARLLLSYSGLGVEFSDQTIAHALAAHAGANPAVVQRAIALTDPFEAAAALEKCGAEELAEFRLRPLAPVRPALASPHQRIEAFPVWVERKYDGIRFLLHKATSGAGAVRAAAFTRNRHDWLERVPGLAATIEMLPGRSFILDGELFGSLHDAGGRRPVDVAEVMHALHGDALPLTFHYVAFDLLYYDGVDLTHLPLHERRRRLQQLVACAQALPLPTAVHLAEGQLAESQPAVNRLFEHFVRQGHEGIVVKHPDRPYAIGARDPYWLKRKTSDTLDLVLLGATFAVDTGRLGTFGSFVLGARTEDGGFVDVGDVDGLDRERDVEIQRLVCEQGLLTGRRIERQLTHGRRAGVEFLPRLVVTVRFQKVQREPDGACVLRHPVIRAIRTDKSAYDADTLESLVARGSGGGLQ